MAKALIWVIDDEIKRLNSDRSKIIALLNRSSLVKLRAIHPAELETKLLESDAERPDLFLVDYRLNKNALPRNDESDLRYTFTGTAIAGVLRSEYPNVPIYLVSVLVTDEHVAKSTPLFDRVLRNEDILPSNGGAALLASDAKDYKVIRNARPRNSVSAIFRLLRANKNIEEQIQGALPHDLKYGIGNDNIRTGQNNPTITIALSGTTRLAQWIFCELFQYPGVLYDDLYAATYLGVKEKWFSSHLALRLEKLPGNSAPKYNGLFHKTTDRRWWKSNLAAYVLTRKNAKNKKLSDINTFAPDILRVPSDARALCRLCKKPFPETVAYFKDDPDERGPAHWGCSEPDPDRPTPSYFEQFRRFLDK